MGALLDAAVDRYGDDLTVADPFSGGGTVTFEAARRGLKAYAQDLYPWPARGLASALQSCDAAVLADAARSVLAGLAPLRAAYRNAVGDELLSHVLRVRSARCTDCARHFYQFPHPLVSVASRSTTARHAYFGCYNCGTIFKRSRGVATFGCEACHTRWHDLRHEAACRWLAQGLDLRAIQLLLGHADRKTTQRYLNVTDEELRRTMREKLWN